MITKLSGASFSSKASLLVIAYPLSKDFSSPSMFGIIGSEPVAMNKYLP